MIIRLSDANLRLASCTLHPVCSIYCPCMITHNVAFITALLCTQAHSSAASLKLSELIFIHFLPSRVALSLEPSSNSKNLNLTLWLCFLRSVNNCWVKKATVSNHPPLMQRGFFVWRGDTLCAMISARGPHQTQSENLSWGDRGGKISQVAFHWLIAQRPSCYLNPQNSQAK